MKSKSVNFKIAVLFLTFTAVFTLFRSSMSGIFSLFYAKNGIPNANISSIKSFQNIGIMLGLLPAGYLADRIGRLKVLSLSSIVIASSFLILILFRNFLFFSLAELLILLLLNVGYDCGTQFILIYWSIIYVEKLGFNLSLVYTLFMCALILGSIIFNRISTFASSRSITILNTVCMISVFVLSGIIENKYLLLSLFLLIELLMGMMSGQISATSNEAIYGESNKSTMLSTVSFIAEILVSLSLFVSNAIMKWAGNLKVMFFVSAAYFSIVLLIIPLIKLKEELSTK
ncbi:MFS transporter [Lactobacillus johnsonii]|uniref:hypothetical protein n=2 Tax=Lactobacillus johnsonii TaxID=33959 RepID=UPI001CBF1CF7|nr:hypothetical protein [Lactobacillus johnsonii]MBZ4026765.1 hypothetical protein [Lactobacillus johnsonii]